MRIRPTVLALLVATVLFPTSLYAFDWGASSYQRPAPTKEELDKLTSERELRDFLQKAENKEATSTMRVKRTTPELASTPLRMKPLHVKTKKYPTAPAAKKRAVHGKKAKKANPYRGAPLIDPNHAP